MIKLLDLLNIKGLPLGNYKIHLATGPNQSPLRAYFEGNFQRFQEEQTAKNFECDTVIGLISLDHHDWLFAGVYRILGVGPGINIKYLYQTELLPNQEDLIGRVVVHFERPSRASYIWGHRYGHLLEVSEIKSRRMAVMDFPGYNRALLSYQDLRLIIRQQEPGWKAALANVQGIYLITDRSTGKQYVGSACGNGGIWQRWASYAETGHGGNIDLKSVLTANGLEYANNFQYSILEIADLITTEKEIILREEHWKQALLSRQYGYNKN